LGASQFWFGGATELYVMHLKNAYGRGLKPPAGRVSCGYQEATLPVSLTRLSSVRTLFADPHTAFIMDSIDEGHTSASAYGLAAKASPVGLVWDGAYCAFVAGSGGSQETEEVVGCLEKELFTAAVRARLRVAKVSYSGEAWGDQLVEAFGDCRAEVRGRALYAHTGGYTATVQSVPDSIVIEPITAELLTRRGLRNIEDLLGEIEQMWGSTEAYVRSGFGFCATSGTNLLCRCTAEYLSSRSCGIGVETMAEHRNKGIATACAQAIVVESLKRGLTPFWDCWRDNAASARVALKSGFQPVEEYNSVFLRFA
jgi:hypothetical protein